MKSEIEIELGGPGLGEAREKGGACAIEACSLNGMEGYIKEREPTCDQGGAKERGSKGHLKVSD